MNVASLQESLQRLYQRRASGIKLGLATEQAILDRLGNPETEVAAIHVAGTNGKGSVCAMLDAFLRAAGYRSGLYTSPHLVRFNERIRVNGACITDKEIVELMCEIDAVAEEVSRLPDCWQATFFEFTTVMAFEYFRRQGAKIVVIETGMGGRLDATNVVNPMLSVITRIGLEHTEYLGDTLKAVAGEKCGIIKKDRPVICGAMPDEARHIVQKVASEQSSLFIDAAEKVSVRRKSLSLEGQKIHVESTSESYGTITVPLIGDHQLENCATAVAAAELVDETTPLSLGRDAVRDGLRSVNWAARCQVLSTEPAMILDGGHNPDAGRALAQTLKRLLHGRPLAMIIGMCKDKNAAGFLGWFKGAARKIWAVPIKNERSMTTNELAALAAQVCVEVSEGSLDSAMEQGRAWAEAENGVLCITGSLYLAGEVLALMKEEVSSV